MSLLNHCVRVRWCIVLLPAALLAFALPSPLRADQADDDYTDAITHYKKKRWKLAGEALATFVRKHPTHRLVPFARLYRGVSLENQENYREARKVFRGFVKDYPKNRSRSDAMFRVGECSYFLADLKAAEGEFLAFLKDNEKHEFAEFALPYLGDVQFRLQKHKAAAATFQKSLDQFPNGRMVDDAKFGLAHCHAALKAPDKAAALYRELAGQPGSSLAAEAQMELGSLYFDRKQHKQAAAEFDAFEKQFPRHANIPRARLNAGFAWYRLGDFKTAIARFKLAAENKTLQLEAEYWQALAQKSLQQFPRAAELLKAAFERDEKHKLAPALLYEWATCERLQSHYMVAGELYTEFVKRWPKHADADDALYFAGESALLDKKPLKAGKLVARFRKEYPDSDIWPFRDMLQARIDVAGKGTSRHKQAAALLRSVIAKSTNGRTKLLARFHLLRTLRLLGEHKNVLAEAGPIREDVKQNGKSSEFLDALLLIARSELDEKKHADAIRTSTVYVAHRPQGEHIVAALTTRATAAFHAGDKKQLTADVTRLLKDYSQQSEAGQTIHQLAEAAYQNADWQSAEDLFSRLSQLGKTSKHHAPALSGLGWSQFERKDYQAAGKAFAMLLKEHPDGPLAPQAAYKQAECLEKLNKPQAAAAKYLAAFKQFAPQQPARPGSERPKAKHHFTFHAGWKAAQLLGQLGKSDGEKTKAADAAYEALFKAFPKPDGLDQRLNEWALLNYNAGRFKRSDEIFRRLVKVSPKSSLVDNARYTLAESDLNAGRLDAAKKEFVALHAAATSDAQVKEVSLYRLIGIATEQRDWGNAQKWAALLAGQFPKSHHRWYAAFSEAEARFQQNDLKPADRILRKLQQEKPNSIAAKSSWFQRVWLLLAESAIAQSHYNDVEKTIAEGKRRFSKWPQAFLFDELLGRSFKQQAKFKAAREAFARVLLHKTGRNSETAAKCQFLIGDTYLMEGDGDFNSARKAYYRLDAVYEIPRWQAPALYMAAQCEEKLKDFKAAVKTYQDLIRRFPKSQYAAKAKPRLAAAKKRADQQ